MRKRNSIDQQKGFFSITLVITVLLVIVGVGAYYVGTRNAKTEAQTTTNSQSDIASPTLTPTATQISSSSESNYWKEYTSKLGIKFKYPQTWIILSECKSADECISSPEFEEGGKNGLVSKGAILRISRSNKSSDVELNKELENICGSDLIAGGSRCTDEIINGIPAKRKTVGNPATSLSKSAWIVVNNYLYTVNMSYSTSGEPYGTTLAQILSTFKFSD